LHLTCVRRVDGNLGQLAQELQILLGKSDDEVVINRMTRQVSVKVWATYIRRAGADYEVLLTNELIGTSQGRSRQILDSERSCF